MKIGVIGTGYVGLVLACGLADSGNNVIGVDIDKEKVEKLNNGIPVIFEPGLEDLLVKNLNKKRIRFTTDIKDAVENSDIIYIAVGTPSSYDGSADLRYVMDVAESIGRYMNGYKIIIIKSTVPVGTADKVKEIIKSKTNYDFDVVSNPEFLKEGAAVMDFLKPDRIIVGTTNPKVREILKELYEPFVRTGNPIIFMDNRSAEVVKYASNAMLATRISFMNEIANFCEKVGADVHDVRVGVGSDPRIGPKFLFPGVGFGGSCFPKDLRALIRMGDEFGVNLRLIKATYEVNEEQKKVLAKKVINYFGEDLSGRTFAVWGLSFKPNTDDMREAPSIVIINMLLEHKATINVYDPAALENAKKIFKDRVNYFNLPYEPLKGADALLIITEWNEFRYPDFEEIKRLLKNPIIFDGRNLYSLKKMKELGFKYFGIGRGVI